MANRNSHSDIGLRELQAQLPSLIIFQCVARHLNFARAAEELLVTPTAISKSIKNLELQMGVRLFNRNTRSTALTEAGQKLLTNLKPAIEQIKYSLDTITHDSERPAGLLRISSSYVAYANLIEPHLANFLRKFPSIILDISIDSTLVDIIEGGFDAGIRLGHAVEKDMVIAPLGAMQDFVAVASPSYLDEQGVPAYPNDLLHHSCIRQRFSNQKKVIEWAFNIEDKLITVNVDGSLIVDEMRLAANAAVKGIGVAYVFRQFVEKEISAGELITILEKFSRPRSMFHIYFPNRRQMPGKLRAFIDFIRTENMPN
ncbi:LysR family transcriptional regulator [Rheinheimera sp. MM224]|uniref:LysR family transcriptional regulator n=1 Tax=Rheinheimera sp. MM224 TaxID=3019969 RepID=UPI0021F8DEF1|nr:LysR family transcriptional regulator [Rheinheimera sp. MM224]CAI3798306.1 HTH-type transcriptional regulator PgrR [Rheinheimera sp. MM224]